MGKLGFFDGSAMMLVLVGAINWGLVGLFDFNLVTFLFGDMTTLARIVYITVGLSAFYMFYAMFLGRK